MATAAPITAAQQHGAAHLTAMKLRALPVRVGADLRPSTPPLASPLAAAAGGRRRWLAGVGWLQWLWRGSVCWPAQALWGCFDQAAQSYVQVKLRKQATYVQELDGARRWVVV